MRVSETGTVAEWLQVLVTISSIAITVALLMRQLRRAKKRIRVRPRLDIVRIVVQFVSIIVVAALMGSGAPLAALILVGLFAVGPGYVQGRNLVITDDDGRLYAVRNTVAAGVWAAGLVIMQLAGLLRRTGILGLGQATAWVGVGLAIGLFVGRRGPVAEYRQTAGRVAAPVSAVIVGLLAVATFGDGRQADAQETGQWVQVGQQVNPGGDPAPPGYDVTLGATSMTVVESFGPEYPDDGEATFEASWEAPPQTLVPGDQLTIPVTVSGRNTGNLDTQYFFGLDVILIVDGGWNRESVGAGANCAQTTVISGVYVCSDPVTNTGEMSTRVPGSGDGFSVGIGALNCGGACYVEWSYEFEGPIVAEEATTPGAADDPGAGGTAGIADGDDPGAATEGQDGAGSSDVEQLEGLVEQQTEETGIEPNEAMQAAIAGVIAALATGGISLIEAMEQVPRIFEEGSTVERRPRPHGDEEVRVYDPRTETATWMTQEEADEWYGRRRGEDVAASIAAGRRSGAEWTRDWERAAAAERVAERAARDAAQEAWDRYVRLGDLAIDQNRLDILERLSRDESVFDENGNLDVERLGRLTDMMRDHLWGEQLAPDPAYSETGQLIVDIGTAADEFSRSIPVRIAAGMATGGMSEIYHQGRTVVEAVRDAAGRSVEWTFDPATGTWKPPQEDFGVVDGIRVAMDANARENIPGYNTATTLLDPNATAADVAGAALWDAIGARMARGELDQAIDQMRRLGPGGRVRPGTRLISPDPNLPTIRAGAGEVITPGPYSTDFLPQHRVGDDLRRLARGEVVPNDLIHQTGWSQAQMDHMNRIARANDAIIDARSTNPDSMRLIREGEAVVKPLAVKPKTLTIVDYYAGGCELDDIGKVGFYDPTAVTRRRIPQGQPVSFYRDLDRRIQDRAEEFGKYRTTYDTNPSVEVRGTVVYDKATGLPIAGDIDAVAFRDRATGQPLTGERLERAEAMWRGDQHVASDGTVTPASPEWQAAGAGQHGAEVNSALGVLDGKVQARVAGLDPAHPDYLEHLRQAQHAGYADARDFQNGLLDNSVGPYAGETTLSVDGSGAPRIADTEWAADLIR